MGSVNSGYNEIMLSFYLFLLCAKRLFALMHKVELEALIHRFSTSRNDPKLTYMFFAENILPFCNGC